MNKACAALTNDLLLDHAERMDDRNTRLLVGTHLKACPACRIRFEEIRVIAGSIARLAPELPTPQAMARLDRIVLRSTEAARPVHLRRFLVIAGTAAAALLLVILALPGKQPDSPPVAVATPYPSPVPSPDGSPRITPAPAPLPPKPSPRWFPPLTPSPSPTPAPTPEPSPLPAVSPESSAVPPSPSPLSPLPSPVSPPSPEPAIASVAGDLNSDGKVDVADWMMISAWLNEGEELETGPADLNGDGKVDVADAFAIAQVMAEVDEP